MAQKTQIKNKKYSANLRLENTKNQYTHLKYKNYIHTRQSKKYRCNKIELFRIHISPIFLHNLRLYNKATISTLQRPRIIRSLRINTIILSAVNIIKKLMLSQNFSLHKESDYKF